MSDIGAFIAKAHGPDEALVLNRAPGEVRSNCLNRVISTLHSVKEHIRSLGFRDKVGINQG